MGYIKTKVEFPCGYKEECEMRAFGGQPSNDFGTERQGCPLHGKKCKK